MMQYKTMIYGMIGAVAIGALVSVLLITQDVEAQSSSRLLITQKTVASAQDPLPGHEGHQLVLAVPPRSDGKLWAGEVVWTASQPVEVVVLHWYDQDAIDSNTAKSHGQPLIAQFPDGSGRYVAITLYKSDSNTPVPSGSTSFVGSALAFHTLDGKPFTVTYSVKAIAFTPNE